MLQCLVPVSCCRFFTPPSRTSPPLPEAAEAGQRPPSLPAGGCLLTAGSGARKYKDLLSPVRLFSLCSENFRARSTWPRYVVSGFKGFTEYDCRPLCVFVLSSLTVVNSFVPTYFSQRGTWLPREASIHLLLATPQSSIPRDMSLDLNFNPHRLLLRITHPLKTILIQGRSQRNTRTKTPTSVWV